jgi:dUTP pyrophosphatase
MNTSEISEQFPIYQERPTLYLEAVHQNAKLPTRATRGSAGFDLYAAESVVLPARSTGLVETGLRVRQIPRGCYGRLAARSGLAYRHDLVVGAGVVDWDYRGPIGVVVHNLSNVDYEVGVGDRVAQLVLEHYCRAGVELSPYQPTEPNPNEPNDSKRGASGFGSSGK